MNNQQFKRIVESILCSDKIKSGSMIKRKFVADELGMHENTISNLICNDLNIADTVAASVTMLAFIVKSGSYNDYIKFKLSKARLYKSHPTLYIQRFTDENGNYLDDEIIHNSLSMSLVLSRIAHRYNVS